MHAPQRLLRRALLAVVCLGALPGSAGADASLARYNINQRYGSIGFSISELGLFDTGGSFRRFAGELAIDPQNPAQTRIDVAIAANSVTMSSTRAVQLLLSPAYFDAAMHPAIRFQSTSVAAIGHDRYRILGTLRIRGITHPQTLIAVLAPEKSTVGDPRTAYFTVTGRLHRSAYGMTANRNFLGDVVRIIIHIHLTLPQLAHAD